MQLTWVRACAPHKVPRAPPGVIPEHRALSTGPASRDPDPAFPSPQSQPVSGASPYLVWEADPCRGESNSRSHRPLLHLGPLPKESKDKSVFPCRPLILGPTQGGVLGSCTHSLYLLLGSSAKKQHSTCLRPSKEQRPRATLIQSLSSHFLKSHTLAAV